MPRALLDGAGLIPFGTPLTAGSGFQRQRRGLYQPGAKPQELRKRVSGLKARPIFYARSVPTSGPIERAFSPYGFFAHTPGTASQAGIGRTFGAAVGDIRSRQSTFATLLVFLLLLVCSGFAQAQEDPPQEAKPHKPSEVRITFLPPPIEGTLSLGIYNKAGKLVRVLHREATEKEFTVGLNGLITTWDGKDDTGLVVPPGKYFARGFSVGALDVEGVAYHCNDFMVDDDSPRVSQLLGVQIAPSGEPVVIAKLADEKLVKLAINEDGTVKPAQLVEAENKEAAAVTPEKPLVLEGKEIRAGSLPDLQKLIDAVRGKDNTLWIIDETSSGTEVKQYASDGDFLRRLAPAAGEPTPRQMAASKTDDRIYLLESAPGVQRVRGLARENGPVPSDTAGDGAGNLSTWKTLFSKQITASDSFSSVADKLERPQPFQPEPQINVRLLPNPLFKNMPASVSLEIGNDAKGSYLRTADALPLVHLTETRDLKWAVMGRENGSRAVTIFQSDGTIVEEFRLRKLANMMAFDAGEYEWTVK